MLTIEPRASPTRVSSTANRAKGSAADWSVVAKGFSKRIHESRAVSAGPSTGTASGLSSTSSQSSSLAEPASWL